MKIQLLVQSVARIYFGICTSLVGFNFLKSKESSLGWYLVYFNWFLSVCLAINFLLAKSKLKASCKG